MNLKTFEKLLEIKFNNDKKMIIEFCFEGSGTAKITKIDIEELNEPKKIKNITPIKNFLRSFYHKLFRKY